MHPELSKNLQPLGVGEDVNATGGAKMSITEDGKINPNAPIAPLLEQEERYKLRFLSPNQYESWCKKVDDPEWTEHRYRDKQDRWMANAIKELRGALTSLAAAQKEAEGFLTQAHHAEGRAVRDYKRAELAESKLSEAQNTVKMLQETQSNHNWWVEKAESLAVQLSEAQQELAEYKAGLDEANRRFDIYDKERAEAQQTIEELRGGR